MTGRYISAQKVEQDRLDQTPWGQAEEVSCASEV